MFHGEGLNIRRRYEILHGGGEIFHGGVKHSTKMLRHYTEVSHIPRRGLYIPRRYEIFHADMKYLTQI